MTPIPDHKVKEALKLTKEDGMSPYARRRIASLLGYDAWVAIPIEARIQIRIAFKEAQNEEPDN